MTLIAAQAKDEDLITRLWLSPDNAPWIEPPEPGEVRAAIDAGLAFLWNVDGVTTGFAVLMAWVPRVFGLSALVTTTAGQGSAFLRALLAQVFGALDAHRLGLDVTVDNVRAIALYERLGFVHEGRVRECWLRPGGDWVDCLLMGILAKEWQK